MTQATNLTSYLQSVARCVRNEVRDGVFAPSQQGLLARCADRVLDSLLQNPYDSPLGLHYLVARAWGRAPDEQAEQIGAFLVLYVASADLFDDVQDNELAGKEHESAGAAIAINDAITLLFLALRALRRAIELESEPARRISYLRVFNRASVLAAAGQHRDLSAEDLARSPEDVLGIHQAKTSSMGLVIECAALLGRCDDELCAHYRRVGECLAQIVQVVDDLRDVFGKPESADLAANKATYPLVSFLHCAAPDEIERFRALQRQLPRSLPEIRRSFYDSGAVARSAEAIEDLRREVHRIIAHTGNRGAPHRVFLSVIDRLAGAVYEPERLPETARWFEPQGGFHDLVRNEALAFAERMAGLGAPPLPSLEPWHLPYYLYEPARTTVYYPDLEELTHEIAPFQAELLGASDESEVREKLLQQLPAVLAHEMFHRWRHAAGRLTNDSWHEEYSANRLAVGYVRRFSPTTLERFLPLADRVLSRFDGLLDDDARHLLANCSRPSAEGRGYGMDQMRAAVVHLEMVRRLAEIPLDLETDVATFLGAPGAGLGVAAAIT